MTYFIFVVSGDGSCHRLESRSASVGERRCDMSLGLWLKILHLATKTATSFLQIRNHNGSYIVSMGFGGRSEVWRAPYLAIPGAPPLAVPVIESTFLLLYAFMFGRCFILAMLLSCPGGGLNVYLFTLAWCDLY